jgi:hypothetical protein
MTDRPDNFERAMDLLERHSYDDVAEWVRMETRHSGDKWGVTDD